MRIGSIGLRTRGRVPLPVAGHRHRVDREHLIPGSAVLHHVELRTTQDVAERLLPRPTRIEPLVALAYHQLQTQTDRQYASLMDPHGLFQVKVVSAGELTPYADADEIVASVRTTHTLEVTTAAADRTHPLDGAAGGAYFRFRAVHDLVGHVATGYGFDADGEYSAWLAQRRSTTGSPAGCRSELHGEISVLRKTQQFAEHKAALPDPELFRRSPLGAASPRCEYVTGATRRRLG